MSGRFRKIQKDLERIKEDKGGSGRVRRIQIGSVRFRRI